MAKLEINLSKEVENEEAANTLFQQIQNLLSSIVDLDKTANYTCCILPI